MKIKLTPEQIPVELEDLRRSPLVLFQDAAGEWRTVHADHVSDEQVAELLIRLGHEIIAGEHGRFGDDDGPPVLAGMERGVWYQGTPWRDRVVG